jgi:hypothetical protein
MHQWVTRSHQGQANKENKKKKKTNKGTNNDLHNATQKQDD